MELSLFLAQLLGSFFVLFGILVIVRSEVFMQAVHDFSRSKGTQLVAGIVELLAGLAIILTHNVWVVGYEVVVTIIGWLFILESLIYLTVPTEQITRMFSLLSGRMWFVVGGMICIVVGAYLAAAGFGFL